MKIDVSKSIEQRDITANDFVDISSYTSSANPYVCPCDGYARVSGTGQKIAINGYDLIKADSNDSIMAVFVRAGAKLSAQGVNAKFIKLD